MAPTTQQFDSLSRFCVLFALIVHGTSLVHGSATSDDCSGHFIVEDSTVKLIIQQYVNSTESIVECRYYFKAPQNSGLLIIANDIKAVNDAEIPGCPVAIYNNAEATGDPVYSLCGHYGTTTIPVPASTALVVYKPEFKGEPYTLTMDLQVVLTGGSNLRACGDSLLSAVSAVPIRYSVGFRADAGSGDASDFCDLNVTSKDDGETLGTKCVLTSEGVCNYQVLLSDGSVAESADSVDLSASGGSATVRLNAAGITGVLVSNLPAGFVPLSSLEPPVSEETVSSSSGATDIVSSNESSTEGSPENLVILATDVPMNITEPPTMNATDYNATTNGSTIGGEDDGDLILIIDYGPPTFWERTTHWVSETWTTMYYTVTFTMKSVETWFYSWF